jgi:hypothetical protein
LNVEGKAPGTIIDDAYILNSWWMFLETSDRAWASVDDLLIQAWGKSLNKGGAKYRRVGHDLHVLFHFYNICQNSLGLISGVIEDPRTRIINDRFPISVVIEVRNRSVRYRERFPYRSWARSERSSRRPTPSSEEAEQVLTTLSDNSDVYQGQRLWLTGAWMYKVGLRCAGVAGLTVSALSRGLAEAGICDGRTNPPQSYDLEALSNDSTGMEQLLQSVAQHKRLGTAEIYVRVVEKGAKVRLVPVETDFLIDNLYFIWGARASLIERFKTRNHATDALLISCKTLSRFKAKSLGNNVKAAFLIADVRGSAHRLRAAFLQRITWRGYLKARAAHGHRYDAEGVLLVAAEIAGHSGTGSLRYYLDDAIRKDALLPGEPILITDPSKAPLMRHLAAALETHPETIHAVRKLLDELGIEFDDNDVASSDLREKLRGHFRGT